jgi:site-specific DNA-cytosine methylase
MNVLSLFDGMSCGQLALREANVPYSNYYASEINKYAIAVTQHNFPNTVQVGDVCLLIPDQFPKIDLLIGGTPCQGFSCAGKGLNFEDPRSKLFFEYVRLKNQLQPEYFLLENVKMKKEYQDVISQHLGVEPVMLNSGLVSAQLRTRLYWTNLPIPTIEDKGILVKDILEDVDYGQFYYLPDEKIFNLSFSENGVYYGSKNKWGYGQRNVAWLPSGKHGCLAVSDGGRVYVNGKVRKTTRREMERLQTVPDGYTDIVSYNQAMGLLGNGWTVDIIVEFFKSLN